MRHSSKSNNRALATFCSHFSSLLGFMQHLIMYPTTPTTNSLLESIHRRLNMNPAALFLCLAPLFLLLSRLIFTKKPRRDVYLLDFACYKGTKDNILTKQVSVERYKTHHNMSEETSVFMQKMLERSGIGESAYLPDGLVSEPPCTSIREARNEAEAVMFGAIDVVLAKTGVIGEKIGILIVNCSVFNVAPSLCSMIVNRYKLGDGVLSFNLGGMGCSAGLSAIGLAKQLLQHVHRDRYALVVSTENITQNCYEGNNRSMLIVNSLFRVGGAAILLSNRSSDRHTSKYQLVHTVHNNTAGHDRSYNCIYQEEDEDGKVGVSITKDLMVVALKTIEANIIALSRLVLPLSEQIRFVTNYFLRNFHLAKTKPYVPNPKQVFDHFFPHVGAKPVLDELQKNLGFTERDMEASRMTLYRFGNTSSSSIWYALAYAEAKGRIKRGDRVWQFAFGSGFKCNSLVWKATRDVGFDSKNPWSEEINEFPVDVSGIGAMPYYFEPAKET